MNFFSKTFFHARVHLPYIILLILGVAIIYWPVYKFNFLIGWDDQWLVTNRYTENGCKWDNLYEIWTAYYRGQYAPLNQMYYTTLYMVFGYSPPYFHIAAVLVHLCNVILIYFFLNTVTVRVTDKPVEKIRQISFLTAFLFAILPVNIESVAWVSASKVPIYALLYLASLLWYSKYAATRKSPYYYLTLIAFILSFAAKEQAISLPVCLFLIDYAYRRSFRDRKVWLEKLPFFILALLFGIITIYSQELEFREHSFYPLYQRIPLAFYTLSEYFTKCLIPVNISYLYPFPFQMGEHTAWWLWIYVVIVPLIIYFLYDQIKIRWVLFGLLFFVIHILLVMNFFSIARFSVTADRYAYLSSIGLCYIVSYIIINHLYQPKLQKPLLAACLLYIGLLLGYSCIHITTWANAFTLKSKLRETIEQRNDFNELKIGNDERK